MSSSVAEREVNSDLKIPVMRLENSEKGEYQNEPDILNNSILGLLKDEIDLSSLVVVKLNPDVGKELRDEDPDAAEEASLDQLEVRAFERILPVSL